MLKSDSGLHRQCAGDHLHSPVGVSLVLARCKQGKFDHSHKRNLDAKDVGASALLTAVKANPFALQELRLAR